MSKKFIPSAQQSVFFDWGLNGSGNAFVEAVAGAGKTTSLLEFTKLIRAKDRDSKIIIVAYSKKIAQELKEKLTASNIQAFASTFHAFGFSAWRFHTKNACKMDGRKLDKICEALEVPEGYISFVKSLVSLAKQNVLSHESSTEMLEIVNHHSLFSDLDKNHNVREGIEWAQSVLKESNRLSRTMMDFDDMIYLPVFYGINLLKHDFVMVDEAQDTNPARRMMAAMMIKPRTGRIIFVGDRKQAIFGFTGADSNAVDVIMQSFNCTSLPLTVTYRCPKAVVTAAQQYVSHIVAHESAPEGLVRSTSRENFEKEVPSFSKDDAILCRKTSPLITLAYRLIRLGVACHVEGRDIGMAIKQLLTKWKSIKNTDVYLEKLTEWERIQVEKLMIQKKELVAEAIKDRCETIRVLSEGCDNVACMVAKVEKLFGDSDSTDEKEKERCNNLTLSTVHKSKGREWNKVAVLGFSEYMPSSMAKQSWEKEQENNLIYVAFTRAKEELVLVG